MDNKKKGIIGEFKEFISRGNVMDMAIGIIIGGAFTTIVNSLVNDVAMPVIARITGGIDFTFMNIVLGEGEEAPILAIGSFIMNVVNFLLISVCVFLMMKAVNKFKRKSDAEEESPTTKKCPHCCSEIPIEATKCPFCTSDLSE